MNIGSTITSFNSNGVIGKFVVLNEFVSENSSILCLQEHHLLDHSLNMLSSLSSLHDIFTVPARPTGGRPAGGIATFVPKEFSAILSCADESFLACKLFDCVLVNCYLPTDYHVDSSFEAFTSACHRLSSFIALLDSSLRIFIFGDFNCDLESVNERSTILFSSLPNFNICRKTLDFTYSHWSGSTSNIDHVLFNFSPSIIVKVIPDFPISDHLPIQFLTSFSVIHDSVSASNFIPIRPKYFERIIWDEKLIPAYQDKVDSLARKVVVPDILKCHKDNIELELNCIYLQLLHCLKYGAKETFGVKKCKPNVEKPFWSSNPFLVHANHESKLAFRHWKNSGKPRDLHPAFLCMKKKKAIFQSELRRHNNILLMDASSEVDMNKKKLWKALRSTKRVNEPSKKNGPSLVEWETHFANLSKSCDDPEQLSHVDIILNSSFNSHDFSISFDSLLGACRKLKPQSSKDHDGIFSNHVKFAPTSFLLLLLTFFNLILKFGNVPPSFRIGVVTPIPKSGKRDLRSCDSYRPITKGSMIGKLFELCIKDLFDYLDVGLNQVGFKKGMGCDHAHATFDTIIKESRSTGSPLYTLLIDIKGAFDNISHASALSALISGGIPLSVVRVLRSWYSGLRIKIFAHTSDSLSNPISVGRGVRQGGVLSPYIFNACLAECLRSLSTTLISWGRDVSFLAYADDIILLSRSKASLIKNFNSLSSLLNVRGLSISIKKCQYFPVNVNDRAELICDRNISFPVSDAVVYLGLPYSASARDSKSMLILHIQEKIRKAFGSIIRLRGVYRREILGSLFNAVALPHVLYPSLLLRDFKICDFSAIRVCYFKYCKFLLGFPISFSNTELVSKFKVKEPLEIAKVKINNFYRKSENILYVHNLFPFFSIV